MMRALQSHTLLCRHLLFWAVIVHLLPATTLVADDELVEKGREIFQRHWVHQPPKIPKPLSDQTVKNRGEFERRLMAAPGDGLGPMHNATSCESCHAGGGAAGVDRNVTLLTLDPRSEFVSKQASSREIRQALLDLYPGLTWDTLQREWRTPPLWGVADSAPYLYDGRAETLDAAIRWHGGEASPAATRYRTLTSQGRAKVIAFLASLRAPFKSNRQKVDRTVEPVLAFAKESDSQNDLTAMAEAISVFDFD
jgi:hypothetical protein